MLDSFDITIVDNRIMIYESDVTRIDELVKVYLNDNQYSTNRMILRGNHAGISLSNINEIMPLTYGCLRNNLELIRMALTHDAYSYDEWVVCLKYVLEHNNVDAAKLLLEKESIKLDPESTTDVDFVMDCVKANALDAIKLLIEYNIDSKFMDAALCFASYHGQCQIVRLLLENGTDVHMNKESALITAASRNQYVVVEILLEHGADIHANDDASLRCAVVYGQQRADGSFETIHQPKTPLDKYKTIKLLLDYGANVNANGFMLVDAIETDNYEVIKLLIDRGANIHINYDLVVDKAIQLGNYDIVKLLVEIGGNQHCYSRFSLSCNSLSKGNLAIAQLLIQYGCDVNEPSGLPLINAIYNNYIELVKLLLECDANIKPKIVRTDLLLYGCIKLVGYFYQCDNLLGCYNINMEIYDNFPLNLAAIKGHIGIIKLLISHGVDVCANNNSALMYACSNNHPKVVQLLLDTGSGFGYYKNNISELVSHHGYTHITEIIEKAN